MKRFFANIAESIKNSRFKKIWDKIRNKYVIATLAFLVWIVFIDENNVIDRFFAWRKMKDLEKTKEYFQEKIKKDQYEMKEMDKNKNLERLAREKYLMKKKNEDIYIIKEDEQ